MLLNLGGQLSLLRVHDLGTGYGPPFDSMDVEVVVQFVGRPLDAFGFQLRNDENGPARQGMLDLLRDAFNHGWTANVDYDIEDGKHNGTIMRVWITKLPGRPSVGTVLARRASLPARRPTARSSRKTKRRGR